MNSKLDYYKHIWWMMNLKDYMAGAAVSGWNKSEEELFEELIDETEKLTGLPSFGSVEHHLYLTGSRYYGCEQPSSDWDFFGTETTVGRHAFYLISQGWEVVTGPYHKSLYLKKGTVDINLIVIKISDFSKWAAATSIVDHYVNTFSNDKKVYVDIFENVVKSELSRNLTISKKWTEQIIPFDNLLLTKIKKGFKKVGELDLHRTTPKSYKPVNNTPPQNTSFAIF